MIRNALLMLTTSFTLNACDEANPLDQAAENVADENNGAEAFIGIQEVTELQGAMEAEEVNEWKVDALKMPPSEPVFNVLDAKSGYQYFAWKKGMPPVKMGLESDKLCFLASVNGTFGDATDTIDILAVNGEWVLQGSGNTAAASAVCISQEIVTPANSAYWATNSTNTLDLGSSTDRACFIRRLRGRFNGKTSGAGVTGARLAKSADGTRWLLRVDGYGVGAGVTCVKPVAPYKLSVSDELNWQSGQSAKLLASGLNVPCMLTAVTGNASSPGDWGGLWLQEIDEILRQTLGGNAFTTQISIGAHCIGASVI